MNNIFPKRPNAHPIIYAYNEPGNPAYKGMYKVGYTARTLEKRMSEHYPTARPGELPYEAFVIGPAIRPDGSTFRDHAVFDRLKAHGFPRLKDAKGKLTEWFTCSLEDIKTAYLEVYGNTTFASTRTENFSMRQEQEDAVIMTKNYFENAIVEGIEKPQFLWNAKMRFGKTFAAYQLAKAMGLRRILVMSFKTAVEAAWEDDLATHVDFEGWQFVTRDNDLNYEDCDQDRPIVCFGSFQDILQLDAKTGTIKQHNKWIHEDDWDLVILDEYHFGAWRENAKKLFESVSRDEEDIEDLTEEEIEKIHETADENEWELPITSKYYLYLSGTPFRALNSGEFMEDQIFSWTYSDEQERKETWDELHPGEKNPYEALPRVVLMTYRVPEAVIKIARRGENNRFSLNEFFRAEGEFEQAQFVHKEEVQKWLDFIRSKYTAEDGTDLKMGKDKAPFPFSDTVLLNVLVHTIWFLPNVASCYAMANLLHERVNTFYHDYDVIVAAGPKVGNGVAALGPVREAMKDPTESKTITLTCGKLTTGVTVKPWAGIFMLRDLNSPETYFQSAFRVQSPWVVDMDDENGIITSEIMKREVYIFDFAIQRALSMVATYAAKLAPHGGDIEKAAGEFIQFLPVLAYDEGIMRPLNAEEILDMTVSDTTATMLARRWKSAMLVNVDDATLMKVMEHPEALKIIDHIESFRTNSADTVKKIIASSEDIKKGKREAADKGKKPGKEITDEEKKLRKLRSKIQKTLLKFISRIPVFMYLTDNREQCLQDIIRKLEPKLFTNVTGIKVDEFETLIELGVIDEERMNESVFLFRRYEDSSLTYTGIDKHAKDRNIGLFSRTITEEEFEEIEITPPDDYEDPLGLGNLMGDDGGEEAELDTDKPRNMPDVADEDDGDVPEDLVDDDEADGEVSEQVGEQVSKSSGQVVKSGGQVSGEVAKSSGEVAGEGKQEEKTAGKTNWTREAILALKIGSFVKHRQYGDCEVLNFSGDGNGICIRVNGGPCWYSIPPAEEETETAEEEAVEETSKKEKSERKHGKDYKRYWKGFYAYCKGDPEMTKMFPGIGDRKAQGNVYISIPLGYGNDCRFDVYYRVATNTVNLMLWCKTDKRWPELLRGRTHIDGAVAELSGSLSWDEREMSKASRKAEVSKKMSDDPKDDYKWICDWAKALKPAVAAVLK